MIEKSENLTINNQVETGFEDRKKIEIQRKMK